MAKKTKKKAVERKVDWSVMERVEFIDELNEELKGSERAAILVAGTMVDEVLRRLLRRFLVDCKAAEELIANSPTAPLGSFSSRITAAFALGLITEGERNAFNLIRSIRNDYAHRLKGELDREATFDQVRELVRGMNELGLISKAQLDDLTPDGIKNQIASCATICLQRLLWRLDQVDTGKRQELREVKR